ncbi:GDP-mannose 4,6-dehydratase [Pelotomaculum propionicicum]|uniref:GDP-6-deoxy-D-mannose reductase n=1 Tax=Pelotomaculum propionicicum TaxID=258475 RepID=A0A4Y7RKG9_9FIRM|nr:GDP-mannose 4,6-dehydratase [Pelotomaculum propionicicum]TEB09475.1 GDP-6-deoxy-D-mannose reductase [Pelotomaculum propionicicum]
MTILITGATGFAGRHLIDCLHAKGARDIYGTYHSREPGQAVTSVLNLRQLDITDGEKVNQLIDEIRPKEIYHLAAVSATTVDEPKLYYQVNFSGTVNLLEAVRQIVPYCRVLYVSSANIYGPVPEQEQPIREEQALCPVNHYAAAKASADLVSLTYGINGLKVIRVRPFNHTGPGQENSFVCSRMAQMTAEISMGLREPVIEAGNLAAARDFTDVRDVVEAYRLLLQKGCPGEVYNVCSGEVYSVREIISLFSQLAGIEIRVKSRPDLLRGTDIAMLRGCREKITRETGWRPKFNLLTTLNDLFFFWKRRLENHIVKG